MSPVRQGWRHLTCIIRTLGRLYGESGDDAISTGELAIESAYSGLESVDSTANSTTDLAKIGVWVQAFSVKTSKPTTSAILEDS